MRRVLKDIYVLKAIGTGLTNVYLRVYAWSLLVLCP
jgi:hypothetical protein